MKKIEERAFLESAIKSITIPGTVEKIETYAFNYCKNLKEVVLNEGLKEIAAEVFRYTAIESITIPGTVKEVGWEAFAHCDNLKK